MDISEKQAVWREQKPLFEAKFIHSHLLPFFNFNEKPFANANSLIF